MTNAVLDNSVDNEQVILWQYDQAVNLIRLIRNWNGHSDAAVRQFWDFFLEKVLAIDAADGFGLAVIGRMLGIARPILKVPDASAVGGYVYIAVSDDLYRRLLKARFYLLFVKPSVPNYNCYLSILFPDMTHPIASVAGEGLRYAPRNKVIDYGLYKYESFIYDPAKAPIWYPKTTNMSMGFTFPTNATEEEAYLIFQHYDIVYPYPAAIRCNSAFVQTGLVIGLNNTKADGQKYRNFANSFAWVDDGANGGIFSTTEGANYKVDPKINGRVLIVNASATGLTQEMSVNASGIMWVDWGDSDSNYRNVTASASMSHTYSSQGLYAVCVYSDSAFDFVVKPTGTTAEYAL